MAILKKRRYLFLKAHQFGVSIHDSHEPRTKTRPDTFHEILVVKKRDPYNGL